MILPLLLAAAGIVSPPELSDRFSALLERDDLAAVVVEAGPDADLESYDWFDVREEIVRLDCIDVRATTATTESATGNSVTLRIELAPMIWENLRQMPR